MASKARKVRTPDQLANRLARRLLPAEQANRGGMVIVDVSNRTDAQQRHSIRSQETETIRKLSRVEKLQRAGILERHEAQACQWYADAYALGYDTIGVTADYQGSGVRAGGVYCLASRYRAQQEARADYAYARRGIPQFLLPLFEGVVLEGRSFRSSAGKAGREASRLALAFRLAANRLHEHIAHLLPLN